MIILVAKEKNSKALRKIHKLLKTRNRKSSEKIENAWENVCARPAFSTLGIYRILASTETIPWKFPKFLTWSIFQTGQ